MPATAVQEYDYPSVAADTRRLSYWSSLSFAREVDSTVKGRLAVAIDTSSASCVVGYCTYRVGRCVADEEPGSAGFG